MTILQEFKTKLAKDIFGETLKEVHEKGICINCKMPALSNCYSELGIKEYHISGLCEKCFDEITGEI